VKHFLRLATVLVAAFATGTASAHHVWLEPAGDTIQLYFGEFGDNVRETSPGLLDRLQPQARATSAAGEKPLTLGKAAGAFAVSGTVGPSDGVIAEDIRYPISVRTRDGSTTRFLWWPAARLVRDRSALPPLLTLDVVPAGGNAFQVFFKGKPLPKAKVGAVAAFGWSKEVYTDEEGRFEVALPWRGAYAFEVHHTDRTPGKRGEEAYDTASYVTTLTLVQAQGIDMPPFPAAKPN
jgi:hypothetical protein